MNEPRPFCADVSRDNAEPLVATASRIDRWLLVEYRGLWTHDALAGSGLSDQVKNSLLEQVAVSPFTRLVFIRRPDRRQLPTHVAYAAESQGARPRLRRFEFADHEDLRTLDLGGPGVPVDHPLFLVCTHGKHDRCCARLGRPLYDGFRDEVDQEWVWQTTHIGGDRFAGNVVCLPEGIYYGRATREDATRILDEHLAGRVLLDRYRGRSIYSFGVQAAEQAVRERTGALGIGELQLERVEALRGRLRVTFSVGGASHEVNVQRERGDLTFLTCSAAGVQRPLRYVVTAG